jgi:RNA polymerase sigma-70 factor (ECF subfamily)
MSEEAKDPTRWLPAARAGCSEALGELLNSCRGYLLLVAEHELDPQLRARCGASDLIQETLLDAVSAFDRFQGDSAEELRKWLRRLLLNNLVSFTRRYRDTSKRQVGREVSLDAGERSHVGPVADNPSPSQQAIAHEQVEAIQMALERLPEDYRLVILLRYQEEQSFEDIGRLLELTPNAARKLWLRALKRLQQESEKPP